MQRRLPSFLRASSVLLWGLLPACTGRHADSGHPADDTAADTASPTDSGSPDGGGADGGGADGGGDTAADSGDTGTPFDPTICSVGIVSDDPDIGVQAIDVALPDADGAFSVHGVVRWPAELPIKGVLRPMVMVVQGGWDAVITDLHMPGMNGLDLVREIAVRDATLPVIMVSGDPDACSAPVFAALSKPVDLNALLSTLDAALIRRLSPEGQGTV